MDEALRRHAVAVRAEIGAGSLRGRALGDLLHAIPARDRDVWVDAVLDLEEAPPDVPDLPRGAVPYLPCGIDAVLALADHVAPGAAFVDLGSGLGRVAILVHLLTGARAHGVEIQAPLVERARACAARLDLPAVTFELADAAALERDGSFFFLYAPFNGALLTRVLARLERIAGRHPITIATVDLSLADVGWLEPRLAFETGPTIYDSVL